jgi:U1 small nuclear ribonucleoprotein 70kDa
MSAQGLPIALLAQFVPRPPAEFIRPARGRRLPEITPLSGLVELFEKEKPAPREPFESPWQRQARLISERKIEHDLEVEAGRGEYKPTVNPNATHDPYKTLFVGRLSYETTERTLRHVFEEWGRVKDVKIIRDKEGKSRGYAFLEYENERDLKYAYQKADGIRLDGRYILVDVERARTVVDWLPRRLGGGKGPGRVGYDPKKQRKRPAPERRPAYDPHKRPRNDRNDREYSRHDSSRKSSFNH